MTWLLQLKTPLKELILPPAGPLFLALLGMALLKVRPQLARICLIAGFASLWLLSTPVVSDALTGLVELYPPIDLRQTAQCQAIVILGGGGQRALAPEYGGPAAEPFLLERLSYGAYLAKKTGLPILVTGFSLEARAMHDSLQRNFGIETRWIDDRAYDTFQNARNSARILKAAGRAPDYSGHSRHAHEAFRARIHRCRLRCRPGARGNSGCAGFRRAELSYPIRRRCCDPTWQSMN